MSPQLEDAAVKMADAIGRAVGFLERMEPIWTKRFERIERQTEAKLELELAREKRANEPPPLKKGLHITGQPVKW